MGDTRLSPTASPIVGGRHGEKYRFMVLTDGLLRYEWAPDGVFEDRSSTFAMNRTRPRTPKFRLKESESTIEIITSRFRVKYDKQEFSPGGLSVVVTGYTGTVWHYGQDYDTLGGTYRTLDGVNGRVKVGPGVASRNGFANIDDTNSMLFTADGFVASRRPGPGRVDGYLFCYGHDYSKAVKTLYQISGPTPLLPRWALGNWWSRYYEYTQKSYLELMDKFRSFDIPLSVGVIDMDWHLVRDPRIIDAGESGWTGYTWNRDFFPDPVAFVKELHDRKLKVTLNEHPADGVHSWEDMYKKMAKVLNHDTSHNDPIPFDLTDRNFLKAYYDVLLSSLEKDGIDFWWTDWQQGEFSRMPNVDPLWMLNHYHLLHNAKLQKEKKPSEGGGSHPLVFSRYAGPGSHRYPVGFSGDTIVSWESLNFQSEFTATASNIGYGWWSHDIGGHMFGKRDDDLTARWVQLGVLSPIMRLHSTKNLWVCKEPWKLPAGSGKGPQDVVTHFLRLRHRLIPYLHTMNARAANKGEPIVQPMYWKYPERDEAYDVPNQYYFGTEMLVVPITSPQNHATKTGKVRAWLPAGRYADLFTGVVYDGDRQLWLNRTLDKYPVLLKEGSIVPFDSTVKLENGASSPSSIEVVVVVGADGRFELLEEEENGKRGPNGDVHWIRTPITYDQATGTASIGPTTGGSSSRRRHWSIRFLSVKSAAATVFVSGVKTHDEAETAIDNNGTVVHSLNLEPGETALVTLKRSPQLDVNDPHALIFPILYEAEVEFALKDKIEAIISAKDKPKSAQVSELKALDMDPDLRLLVTELLLADDRS